MTKQDQFGLVCVHTMSHKLRQFRVGHSTDYDHSGRMGYGITFISLFKRVLLKLRMPAVEADLNKKICNDGVYCQKL